MTTPENNQTVAAITSGSHGWIQWKGTSVCMDVYCKCGYHSHVDDSFTYYVECPACGQAFECCGYVVLVPIEEIPPRWRADKP